MNLALFSRVSIKRGCDENPSDALSTPCYGAPVADDNDIDFESGFRMYLERFVEKFGERPDGSFVKFGRHMVRKLMVAEFEPKLVHYVRMHAACKKMLETGSTISDALVLDFDEAAAWVAVQAPNIHAMFRGEMGDPKVHAPSRLDSQS